MNEDKDDSGICREQGHDDIMNKDGDDSGK